MQMQKRRVVYSITLNAAARTKWIYTKPITAAVSAELKSMLNLNKTNPHHESGYARTKEMPTCYQKLY